MNRSSSKPTDEWGTPRWLYDLLDEEFGFELDVCASSENHKHPNFLTQKDDALHHGTMWAGTNFCNPPYSKILPWYQRWLDERDVRGATTVGPVKYDPSTKHGSLAAQEMDEIRIPCHRIQFEGAPTGANFPIAIMVCRPRLYTRKSGPRYLEVDYRELMKK